MEPTDTSLGSLFSLVITICSKYFRQNLLLLFLPGSISRAHREKQFKFPFSRDTLSHISAVTSTPGKHTQFFLITSHETVSRPSTILSSHLSYMLQFIKILHEMLLQESNSILWWCSHHTTQADWASTLQKVQSLESTRCGQNPQLQPLLYF